MKLSVVTSVFGDKTDRLKDPSKEAAESGARFYCFTDQNLQSGVWEIIRIDSCSDPRITARKPKILIHRYMPDADVSLWIDASYRLTCNPYEVADRYMWRTDMLALRHPYRTRIDDEGKEIVALGMASKEDVYAQLERLSVAGFDPDRQLSITSTGFCMRRHTPRTARFGNLWWEELIAGGHPRDQMSVDYAAWKTGVDITYLEGHYRANPYAEWSKG